MSSTSHIRASTLPQLLENFGLSLWYGVPIGLAFCRLLYEADPASLGFAGGPAPIVGATLALVAILWPLIVLFRQRTGITSRQLSISGLAMQLVWVYILTPTLQVNPLRGLIIYAGALMLTGTLLAWHLAGRPDDSSVERVTALAVGAVVMAGYLLTLQRTVGKFDTFEFQVTLPVLGIAHPTGYPLYTLLGKLFSLLPLGKVATRINLLSAISATGTVVLTCAMMRRILRIDIIISGLAAIALGLSPLFWSQAVSAEVYALHSVLAAAVLALTLWLAERDDHELFYVNIKDSTLVILLFALTGLGFTNHLTTILLVPGIAIGLVLRRVRLTRRQWLLAVGLFFGSLLIYLYLPFRWPFQHDGYQISPQQFVDWVTAEQFRGALNLRAWLHDPDRWPIIGRFMLNQYGWPGAILAAAGLLVMFVRRWRVAVLMASLAAGEVFFGLNYLVFDIDLFLLPLYGAQAIWIAYGVSSAIEWLADPQRGVLPDRWKMWSHAVLVSALALIPLSAAWTGGATFDWADEQALEAWGRYVLSLPLKEDAVIIADIEKVAPLEYLHRIEHIRPDIEVVVLDAEEDIFGKLFTSIDEGRPVYLARFLPTLEGAFHLRSLGPLVEVGTEPLTGAPSLSSKAVRWENGAELLGYEIGTDAPRLGEAAHLTLYWQAPEPISENYHVWLRLRSEAGEVVWAEPPAHPVDNRYPTIAWKDGEIIPDYHELALPHTLRPGTYRLELGMTPPFSGELSPLATGEATWVEVATLDVGPAAATPPLPGKRVAIAFGGGALLGFDVPERAPDGAPASIIAGWRTGGDVILTASEMMPEDGRIPLLDGVENADVRLRTTRNSNGGGDTLTWTLAGEGLRCGWLRPPGESCTLATTQLESVALLEAIANFDNQLLLTGVQFDTGEVEPGTALPVTLEWQGMRTMDEDYTVFVHLIGPDGRLWGQHDGGPVHSTYPTTIWRPGEFVVDRHNVPLGEDAPPGEYRLLVGLYSLSTNERVVVLGMDGKPMDDKVGFGGLEVR